MQTIYGSNLLFCWTGENLLSTYPSSFIGSLFTQSFPALDLLNPSERNCHKHERYYF